MSHFLGQFVSKVSDVLELNQATLSGAIDIIVVQNDDGTFECTPFHVRFGKLQLLRSREKMVAITVNDVEMTWRMKLGRAGEAFFVQNTSEPVEEEWATSPITSPVSPVTSPQMEAAPQTVVPAPPSTSSMPPLDLTSPTSDSCSDSKDDDDVASTQPTSPLALVLSPPLSPRSDHGSGGGGGGPHGLYRTPPRPAHPVHGRHVSRTPGRIGLPRTNWTWYWGGLPLRRKGKGHSGSSAERIRAVSPDVLSPDSSGNEPETPPQSVHAEHKGPSSDSGTGAAAEEADAGDADIELDEYRNASWMRSILSIFRRSSPESGAAQGGDANVGDPDDPDAHDSTDQSPQVPDTPSSVGSVGGSPEATRVDESKLPHSTDTENVTMSMCAGVLAASKIQDANRVFDDHIVSYDQLCEDPSLVFKPDLVFRFRNKIYPVHVALPLMLSHIVFGRPLVLSDQVLQQMSTVGPLSSSPSCQAMDAQPDLGLDVSSQSNANPQPQSRGWLGWLRKNSPQNGRTAAPPQLQPTQQGQQYFRKSLRPSEEMLRSMNLRHGRNRITFRVTSRMQGTQMIAASVYLWTPRTKIIISDIDGTITRSDVLGLMMPLMGGDWSHAGVATLYTNIKRNGYQILYLTSRAIGQANITRGYIQSLRQGQYSLPEGPIIMSPDRLIHSFKREVVYRRPQEFKIVALRDVRRLFGSDVDPFYAGFGNRPSDVVAYRAVGVPAARIFIINRHGEISQMNSSYKKSYMALNEMVDSMFPPEDAGSVVRADFNEHNFWRREVLVDEDLEDPDSS